MSECRCMLALDCWAAVAPNSPPAGGRSIRPPVIGRGGRAFGDGDGERERGTAAKDAESADWSTGERRGEMTADDKAIFSDIKE